MYFGKLTRGIVALLAVLVLSGFSGVAGAHAADENDATEGTPPPAGYGYGYMGPGMMGGGYGWMGPGMMGGYGPGMMGGGYGWMGPGMMGGYGYGYQAVSPEKQAEAQKIYADFYSQTADLRQQLAAKQSELNALIYGKSTSDSKVQALTKEIADLHAKLLRAQVELQRQLAKKGLQ